MEVKKIEMEKLKNAVIETLPVAVWVGLSAALTYILTALLNKPELSVYYGVINVLLFLVKELKK